MAKTLQQLADYIATEPEIRSLINETVKYLQAEWPPEGSTEVTVYQRKTILTDAQIKALPSTPQTIVAGIVGKVLHFWGASVVCNNIGGQGYGNVSSPSWLAFQTETEAANLSNYQPTGNHDNANKVYLRFTPQSDVETSFLKDIGYTDSGVSGKGIQLYAVNGDGDFTVGDPGNTWEVTVYYSIVDM